MYKLRSFSMYHCSDKMKNAESAKNFICKCFKVQKAPVLHFTEVIFKGASKNASFLSWLNICSNLMAIEIDRIYILLNHCLLANPFLSPCISSASFRSDEQVHIICLS